MKKVCLFILLLSSFCSFSQSFNLQSGINYYMEDKLEESMDFLKKELAQNPKEGKAYFYMALINVQQESYAQGLTNINSAISNLEKTDSYLADAWRIKGDVYNKLNDYDKFEAAYAKALSLNSTRADFYVSRAYCYGGQGLYDKATADLFKAIELDEANLNARIYLSNIYLAQKRYDDVIKVSDRIIKLEPSYTEAYDNRSYSNYMLGNYDLAITDGYLALTLQEKSTRLRDNFISFSRKNYTLALAKISSLIKEQPQKDIWLYIRSQIYLNKKDYKNAISDFSKIFQIIPENYKSYYFSERAKLYGEMGMHEQSINDYTESISLDSSSAYDFANRGDEYRLSGNYRAAVLDFDKAIEMNPEETWFYYRRGWVKDEFLKDPEGGLADYTSAIELDRNDAYPYLHRGRLYVRYYKDTLRANADFRKVVELDTIIGSSGNSRHYGFFELGQFNQAKAWMIKTLQQFPEEGNYYDAACLYSLMKQPASSIAYLDTAFTKGYRDFEHLAKDDDLDNVRNLPEFKSLISRWKVKFDVTSSIEKVKLDEDKSSNKITGTYIIPFKPNGGGTYEVKSKINGLPLNMTFDTGAADILISQTEVDFMLKNGYLNEQDFIGKSFYTTASEERIEARTVMLKQVEIGGLVLKNVHAAVINNRMAGMLFGQSAMSRYGKITIDNQKKQIIITGGTK